MKFLIFFIILLSFYGCNKPKSVLICGDHVCINKAEAKQYFEDNLTLEVQIIDKKENKEINLVEINLNPNLQDKRNISIFTKQKTKQEIKELSSNEILEKKAELKKRRKSKEKTKKVTLNNNNNDRKVVKLNKIHNKNVNKIDKEIKNQKKTNQKKKNMNKTSYNTVDICTILEECSIDEISKYLVEQGMGKKFPDITIREN